VAWLFSHSTACPAPAGGAALGKNLLLLLAFFKSQQEQKVFLRAVPKQPSHPLVVVEKRIKLIIFERNVNFKCTQRSQKRIMSDIAIFR